MLISTEIDVNAPPDAVWAVLADFSAYPAWNHFLPAVHGQAACGAFLWIRTRPERGLPLLFPARVTAVEPPRRLCWRGGLPGLFLGEHTFQLHELSADRTRLVQSENFTGVLAPVMLATLNRDVDKGYARMNADLKRLVESR